MTGVVDYGAGNLASVSNALDALGVAHRVCTSAEDLAACDRIILPGVGHFGAAARHLAAAGLDVALRAAASSDTPLLGICLGLQLLFDGSDEAPGAPGLGLLPGHVVRLEARRVPHMGWNRVHRTGAAAARCQVLPREPVHVYFAHGFVSEPSDADDVLATVDVDGHPRPAVVGRGSVQATQFHPERSGEVGLRMLERFCAC